MENLILHKREKKTLHDAKKGRRSGIIPGVIYGKHMNNIMFEIGELELSKEIAKNGEHAVLNVDVDGETHRTLIKEIQRDPVHNKIIHLDLEELKENETVVTEIPILFSGEELIMKKGGAVQKEKSSVKAICKSDNIPKCINVGLASLNVGDAYRLADVEMAQDITFMEGLDTIIATITVNKKPSDIPEENS
ncbi:50S ribosomal protein L25 [Clostridium sp. A1-XYC3]|uniref:Large ribosomal subunit protein bL25 n=1 Tax=Clostridium tanneri TaxID=3037988 RepID=A0ABU4JT35_9CLOT|nr:50S ribosomal protein L25 [Clostridium sp. A1-XYC3]MDW8801320.1 50S ribosomal protein L25 [Clostridium sp. A1-XYC3]